MNNPETLSSPEIPSSKIIELGPEDIDEILALEQDSWIPELRTDKETILKRFELGHTMLGLEEDGELIGKICYSYSQFSPEDFEHFPKTFQEFSHQSRPEKHNSAFIYNLDIKPEHRGKIKSLIRLADSAMEKIQSDGCKYAVLDGRPSSYNGSDSGQEKIKQNLEFKTTIDKYLENGQFPPKEKLLKDPTLNMYDRYGFDSLWIIPNFIPEDKPAGGVRVIMYKEFEKPRLSLSEEWMELSEAMYGEEFTKELAILLKENGAKRILECGCGNGQILEGLAKEGLEGVGIDNDSEMIEDAKKNHSHPNIEYKEMNWLDIDQMGEQFDAVVCRGNSLTYVNSWAIGREDFNPEKSKELIEESLKKMYDKVKEDGLLYIDTISQKEVEQGGGEIEIDQQDIKMKGKIEHDWDKRTRFIHGGGKIKGREFSGGGISYLMRQNELVDILKSLHPKDIWFPKLEHEINYEIICAKK